MSHFKRAPKPGFESFRPIRVQLYFIEIYQHPSACHLAVIAKMVVLILISIMESSKSLTRRPCLLHLEKSSATQGTGATGAGQK